MIFLFKQNCRLLLRRLKLSKFFKLFALLVDYTATHSSELSKILKMSANAYAYRGELQKLESDDLKKYISTVIDEDPEFMKAVLFQYLNSQATGEDTSNKIDSFKAGLDLFITTLGIPPIEITGHTIDKLPVELINTITGFLSFGELVTVTKVNRSIYFGCHLANKLRTFTAYLYQQVTGYYNNRSMIKFEMLQSLSLELLFENNVNANLNSFGDIIASKLVNLRELKLYHNSNVTVSIQSLIKVLRSASQIVKLHLTNINLAPFNQHQFDELLQSLELKQLRSFSFSGGGFSLLSMILEKCCLQLRSLTIFGMKPEWMKASTLKYPQLKEMRMTFFDDIVFGQILGSTRFLEKIYIERKLYSVKDDTFYPFINKVIRQHTVLNYIQVIDYKSVSIQPILKAIHHALTHRDVKPKGLPSFIKFDICNKGECQFSVEDIKEIIKSLKAIVKYFQENSIYFMFIWNYESITDLGIVDAIGNVANDDTYQPPNDKDLGIVKTIGNPVNGFIYQMTHKKKESNERVLVIQSEIYNRGTYENWGL